MSATQLLEYLEYTADIGDYAQVCDVSSVMVYDQEYRKKQHRLDKRWGEEDVHLATFYLQRRQKRHSARGQTSEFTGHQSSPGATGLQSMWIVGGWRFATTSMHRDASERPAVSHMCALCVRKTTPESCTTTWGAIDWETSRRGNLGCNCITRD